jgi:hypothetical protein
MIRFVGSRCAAALLLCSFALPVHASAEDVPDLRLRDAAAALAVPPSPAGPFQSVTPRVGPERPGGLVPLYVSLATLQVLDVHSTRRALSGGAVEANPLMKGVAANSAGLLAVKAAGTAGVVYASEKMWKKNRVAAVIFMAATNSAMVWVVQHNYRLQQY